MEQMRHLNIAVEEVDEAGLRFHAHPNGAEETLPEAIVQNEEDGLQERLAVLGVPPSINVHDYLAKDDDPRKPVELVFGAIRPIAPLCPEYEPLLVRLLRRVSGYLESKGVGQAYITPMEVVLSTERSLVVRPHVAVVLNEKRGIVRNQVLWGAPHVVVEFSWDATSRRVHTMKARWYGFYGVQELWCVDPRDRRIEVIDMRSNPGLRPHMFRGATPIQSRMLPGIPLCANHIFRPGAEELDEPYQPSTSSVLGLGII